MAAPRAAHSLDLHGGLCSTCSLKRKQFGVPQSAGSIFFPEASLVQSTDSLSLSLAPLLLPRDYPSAAASPPLLA